MQTFSLPGCACGPSADYSWCTLELDEYSTAHESDCDRGIVTSRWLIFTFLPLYFPSRREPLPLHCLGAPLPSQHGKAGVRWPVHMRLLTSSIVTPLLQTCKSAAGGVGEMREGRTDGIQSRPAILPQPSAGAVQEHSSADPRNCYASTGNPLVPTRDVLPDKKGRSLNYEEAETRQWGIVSHVGMSEAPIQTVALLDSLGGVQRARMGGDRALSLPTDHHSTVRKST
jgi:hypothetical protein